MAQHSQPTWNISFFGLKDAPFGPQPYEGTEPDRKLFGASFSGRELKGVVEFNMSRERTRHWPIARRLLRRRRRVRPSAGPQKFC